MHTLPAPPFKGMGKLIHIAAWAILFGLPFFFTGRESQTVTVLSYVRSMIVPLSFMLVFYANYFVHLSIRRQRQMCIRDSCYAMSY